MGSEEEPLAAQEWLSGRGKRRAEAVSAAYGMLGLDYGRGHLDSLYLDAYKDGLRDAHAMAAEQARDWFEQSHGFLDLGSQAQHAEATAEAQQAATVAMAEYRDIRPSGAVISSWQCPEGHESGQDYSQFGPGMVPEPPWERQRRGPDGDWVTVASVREDGSVVTRQPDGTVIISRTWWE